MTNDTSTLNGSLETLGTLMATNLTNKGITSSYTEGLTTLANKINNIQSLEYYYDPLTSQKSMWEQRNNYTTLTYSSNGLKFKGSSGGCYQHLRLNLPTNCEITVLITDVNKVQSTYQGRTYYYWGGVGLDGTWLEPQDDRTQIANNNNTQHWINNVIIDVGDTIKITKEGNTITYYQNDTLLHDITKGNTSSGFYNLFIRNVGASGITLKDLTIKEL